MKQITKEQREELLEQGRKGGKDEILRKITNISGIKGDFMVCKDYKISPYNLSFLYVESTSASNTSPSASNTSPLNTSYQSSCHCPSPYFFEGLPSKLPPRIIHQFLIIHVSINDLMLSKFIQARYTSGTICTKNNILIPCDGIFDGFLKLFPSFHAVSTGHIQLFSKL